MDPVERYARRVVSGELPAGRYHRLACQRHLNDLARQDTPGFPYRFEWSQAERFFRFARKMKHYKGRQHSGKFFEPSENQVFRLGSIFGWRQVGTGYRRFVSAYNELPRKSGKSFEEALVAIYCTFFEGEAGADGFCISTKEKQSRITFDAAKKLVKASGLGDRIKINASNLHRESTESKLEPLGSDSDTTDGLSPHFCGVDELHAFKTRDLLDVMESATGSRVNPLFYIVTTAGSDPVSPCGDQHHYACEILDGVLEDDPSTLTTFVFIAHADPEDDPWSEATWIKANPAWGISVDPDDMRRLAAKAKNMPAAASEFKQKRLNLWVNATSPCLSIEGWRKGQTSWSVSDMRHEHCYVGVDLASKLDLMSLSFLFPPTAARASWRLLNYIWTPEETLRDRAHRDRAPYDVWQEQGWLLTTPGPTLNHNVIRDVLKRHREDFDIELIGFDPWHADKLIDSLKTEDGFGENQVLEVRQTYQGVSSAEGHFQAEVMAGRIDARNCPVTAWAAANVVNQPDGKGNIFFTKKKSRGRIDPIKSATTAMSLALRAATAPRPQYQAMVFEMR